MSVFHYKVKYIEGQENRKNQYEIIISCKIDDNIIDIINKQVSQVKIISIEMMTCYGCINNILNQLGHMDKGGCFYCKDDSL